MFFMLFLLKCSHLKNKNKKLICTPQIFSYEICACIIKYFHGQHLWSLTSFLGYNIIYLGALQHK